MSDHTTQAAADEVRPGAGGDDDGVSSWRRWDQGLKDATLDGPFVEGAAGTIIPNTGPTTSFTITDLDPGVSYTFASKLPGARLNVGREFVDGQATSFRHTVWFDGPFAWLWALLIGRRFRRQLPPTMRLLAEQATNQSRN